MLPFIFMLSNKSCDRFVSVTGNNVQQSETPCFIIIIVIIVVVVVVVVVTENSHEKVVTCNCRCSKQ